MSAKGLESDRLTITGRKEAMIPFGLRLPSDHAKVLTTTARRNRCRGADLLRTAWQEYMINHHLSLEAKER